MFGMKRFDVTPLQVGINVPGMRPGRRAHPGRRRAQTNPQRAGAQVHRGGLVISAVGFLLLVTAHSLVSATIYLAIFGIGNALIRPCVTSLITQKTTVGQGVASGLSSSMDSLGRIIGPLVGALVPRAYYAALCGRRHSVVRRAPVPVPFPQLGPQACEPVAILGIG